MAGPRTPLLSPRAYFASRAPPVDLGRALLVVAAVTLVLSAGVGAVLVAFTAQLDQTVAVDNPDHRPDWACEQYDDGGAFADVSSPAGCDPSVPETVDRRLGDLVWRELSWVPWAMLVVVPLFWLFEGVVLHLGTSLVGGSGRLSDTLAVAGWGMVPGAVRALAVGGLLGYRLGTASLPADPAMAVDAMRAALSGVGLLSGVVTVATVAWATYVRTHGLARARDLSVGDAAVVTVSLSLVGLLFELL